MLNLQPDLKLLSQYNASSVVGIDEAGRGAWAGPLAVGYYQVFPDTKLIPGVKDSKLISKSKRKKVKLQLQCASSGVVLKSNSKIDEVGLAAALHSAISDIIKIFPKDTLFIIDGNFSTNFAELELQVPKADNTYYAVAAASILAKVTRDEVMEEYAQIHPSYHFDRHVGYGTKAHREALIKNGPCNIHRRSFKPISNYFPKDG